MNDRSPLLRALSGRFCENGSIRPLADIAADEHALLMPTSEENSPPYTDADYYGFVLTGLFGVIDDAEASACNAEGIALLRQASDLFWTEFQRRHPGAWDRKPISS